MLLASDLQSYSQALWSMFIYLQHTVYFKTVTHLEINIAILTILRLSFFIVSYSWLVTWAKRRWGNLCSSVSLLLLVLQCAIDLRLLVVLSSLTLFKCLNKYISTKQKSYILKISVNLKKTPKNNKRLQLMCFQIRKKHFISKRWKKEKTPYIINT